MANLQALGADNNTIIYLSAVGHGTEESPYKSIFSAEQYGAWTVTLLNDSLSVTGNFFPDIQAVSQSGVWTITVDNQLAGYATELKQDDIIAELELVNETLAGTLTVDTNLAQPITDTQLRASPIDVSQSGSWVTTVDNQLTDYATESKQNDIVTLIESVNTALSGTLAVDTNLNQPLTDTELRATPLNVAQSSLPGLRIPDHDAIELSYTGADLTGVVYKLNGAIVATLTLAYSNGNLTSVIRS